MPHRQGDAAAVQGRLRHGHERPAMPPAAEPHAGQRRLQPPIGGRAAGVDQGDAGVRARRMIQQIGRQLVERAGGHQLAGRYRRGHLREECQWYRTEFVSQPVVGAFGEVLVRPERRPAGAVGEADHPARPVVAFPVGGVDHGDQGARRPARRRHGVPPARVQVAQQRGHPRYQPEQFHPRPAGDHGMQRHRIRHDGVHLGQQPRGRRQRETARTLTVDDGLDGAGTGALQYFPHRVRMIPDRGLIQVPFVSRQVDAGPPVLQPDVPALGDQPVDHRDGLGCAKQVGAHARSGHQHHRPAPRLPWAAHVMQVELHAVAGPEGDDLGVQRGGHRSGLRAGPR